MPLASQSSFPIIVCSVSNYRPHLSHYWANIIFAIPTKSFPICVTLYWMKNTLLFTYSTNSLVSWLTVKVKNFLTLKMCDPILVTPCKMQPYYGQSSRENATPSNGISPLASYKEVPPSPTNKICKLFLSLCKVIQESHGLWILSLWFLGSSYWIP